MDLQQLFQQPPSAYRGKPFWAWNGKLEPEELRRQVRVFERMGMGGFFMHSRVGLATEYLGKEWFECVGACLDEAKRLGQETWLYDEDRWPSGAAGGLVTRNPRHRMRCLLMQVIEPKAFTGHAGLLGAWEARLEGGRALELKHLAKGHKPSGKPGTRVLAFRMVTTDSSGYYNGYTYLDTLSAEAVREYIRVTHEAYRKHYKKDFGGAIPGIFTDEPNMGCFLGQVKVEFTSNAALLPWTPKLPEIFKERYGYNLLKHLPELFFDVEGQPLSPARYHYRDCVTSLFVEAFARQIGQWCEQNKLLFTGHVLLESPLGIQAAMVGAAMRFYEPMQAPGIDVLTQFNLEYDTAKQCASVANQMGREWMLSELYGCTGWDFPFEGHKALGDWQAALGVNLRCPHLSWYTMAGEAKRDYPASIFFHSPWWEHYRVVEDYFARLGVMLSQGRPVRRLLVIHPMESMWLRLRPELLQGGESWPPQGGEGVKELEEMLVSLRNWLLEAHIDFDYGDEEMLGRLGGVRQGAKVAARLKFNKADYDAVLVPPLLTMRASTLKLLKKFQAAGGMVIFAGEPAPAVEAVASEKPAALAAACTRVAFERGPVSEAAGQAARTVSIRDAQGQESPTVLYMLREEGERRILFICNTDRSKGLESLVVTFSGAKGKACEWDAQSGRQYALEAQKTGEGLRFETELPAAGSRLFVIEPKLPKGARPKPRWSGTREEPLALGGAVQLSEPNLLVLDRPVFRIGTQKPQGPLEILKVDQAARDALGLAHRGGEMVQPWARKQPKHEPSLPVELRYAIEVESLPASPVTLLLETPERFAISLNGTRLTHEPSDGWWIDPCLRQIRIDPALLVAGRNELTLALDFKETDNLEALLLAGDFGVRVTGSEAVLTAPVRELKPGDWTAQGLPFYGGAVTYRCRVAPTPAQGERVFLAAAEFKGSVARVLIGGREVGFLPWPPYELEITDWLGKDGAELEIALEIYGSRRNCFGPLHLADPNPEWIGPGEFTSNGEKWAEDYQLKPCGLLAAPALIYRRAG